MDGTSSLVSSYSVQSHLLQDLPEWWHLFSSRHLQLCSWLDWEDLQEGFVKSMEQDYSCVLLHSDFLLTSYYQSKNQSLQQHPMCMATVCIGCLSRYVPKFSKHICRILRASCLLLIL